MTIDVRAGRLHDEHVGPADVLVDLERDLRVRKPLQLRASHGNLQKVRDLFSERLVRAPRKDLELSAGHGRRQCSSRNHRCPSKKGWGGRIRTSEYGIQSPAP